jgi:FKBP-type peptidyl-prolyl cis-trans isomerase
MRNTMVVLFLLAFFSVQLLPAPTAAQQPAPQAGAAPTKTPPTPKTVTTATGLKYVDLEVGTGAKPKKGQHVIVHYTGWLTNGKKFDSSVDRNESYSFVLGAGKVIKGWEEGVASMRIGGKRKLTIPPSLAYGAKGMPGVIPPNATLIFEVQLLRIR